MGGLKDWINQNDGLHTYSLKYLIDIGTPHAKPAIGYSAFVDAI
jgi:hypothetical protein